MDSVDIVTSQMEVLSEAHIRRVVQNLHHGEDETRHGEVYCVDCGELIPESRLQAMPNAKRCLACQAKYERRF